MTTSTLVVLMCSFASFYLGYLVALWPKSKAVMPIAATVPNASYQREAALEKKTKEVSDRLFPPIDFSAQYVCKDVVGISGLITDICGDQIFVAGIPFDVDYFRKHFVRLPVVDDVYCDDGSLFRVTEVSPERIGFQNVETEYKGQTSSRIFMSRCEFLCRMPQIGDLWKSNVLLDLTLRVLSVSDGKVIVQHYDRDGKAVGSTITWELPVFVRTCTKAVN